MRLRTRLESSSRVHDAIGSLPRNSPKRGTRMNATGASSSDPRRDTDPLEERETGLCCTVSGAPRQISDDRSASSLKFLNNERNDDTIATFEKSPRTETSESYQAEPSLAISESCDGNRALRDQSAHTVGMKRPSLVDVVATAYQRQQRIIQSIEKNQQRGPTGYLEILRDAQVRDFCDYAPTNKFIPLATATHRSQNESATSREDNKVLICKSLSDAPSVAEHCHLDINQRFNSSSSGSFDKAFNLNSYHNSPKFVRSQSGSPKCKTIPTSPLSLRQTPGQVRSRHGEAVFTTYSGKDRIIHVARAREELHEDDVINLGLARQNPAEKAANRTGALQDNVLILPPDTHLPAGFIAAGSPRPLRQMQTEKSQLSDKRSPKDLNKSALKRQTYVPSKVTRNEHETHGEHTCPPPRSKILKMNNFCHYFLDGNHDHLSTRGQIYTFIMEEPTYDSTFE